MTQWKTKSGLGFYCTLYGNSSWFHLNLGSHQWRTGVESVSPTLSGAHTVSASPQSQCRFCMTPVGQLPFGSPNQVHKEGSLPNPTLVLVGMPELFYHGKMLHALTLNQPSKFKCISTEGGGIEYGDKNPKLLCEKEKKGLFLEGGKQRASRNVSKMPCKVSSLARVVLCLKVWRVIYVILPGSKIRALNLRWWSQCQQRFYMSDAGIKIK